MRVRCPFSVSLEPFDDVFVQAQMNRRFAGRQDHARTFPKVGTERFRFRRIGKGAVCTALSDRSDVFK